MAHQAWNVYLNGKLIDTVFYDSDCSADYVRRGLIGHDGFDAAIIVRRASSNRPKFYVGHAKGVREVFKSATVPTESTHGEYAAVIGPFVTKRGAEFMAQFGANNPHCQSVQDAERLAKQ